MPYRNLNNFPDCIQVVLGAYFNALGFTDLAEDDVISLTKNVSGLFPVWTEDGSLIPSAANRIIFAPTPASQWTAKGTFTFPENVQLSLVQYTLYYGYWWFPYTAFHYSKALLGAVNPYTTGLYPNDYTFKDIFDHLSAVDANYGGSWRAYPTAFAYNPYVFKLLEECPTATANFSGTPTTGAINLQVTFTDLSTGATSWLWTFGDGNTSTEQNPVHNYSALGTYTVSLVINGGISTETKSNYITVTEIVPDFSGTPTENPAPLSVVFTDLSTGTPLTWLWNFGDGGSSTEANPVHQYTVPGIYTVTLTVTSPSGATLTKTRTNYIRATGVTFTGTPVDGKTDFKVNFTEASILPAGSTIISYSWDFGDGGSSTAQNPRHWYTQAGEFDVTLTITTDIGVLTLTRTQYITARAGITDQAQPVYGYAPLTVRFNDRTQTVDTRLWNFGDGSTSTEQVVYHTYTAEGAYNVVLTITTNGVTEITGLTVIVTSFKTELISAIKNIADNYGTAEVKAWLGTDGTGWERHSYSEAETIAEGIANAVLARTIERGEPYNGALVKELLAFTSPNKITFGDVFGILVGVTFGVSGSSYNNGGKNILNVDLALDMITTSQRIHTESPVCLVTGIPAPQGDINIDDTVKITQACIDTPDAATVTELGTVLKAGNVTKIPAPADAQEIKVNELIDALINAGLMN